ncbi:MAG: glucuronate isomerase [Balneolaceae bacterium]
MKSFMNEDFLLLNETARRLYQEYAAGEPVIDYHCHLPPDEICENRNFQNLSEIWLHGDHYKWRAMRTCGVDEALITGDASDKEKFMAWAGTVPKTLRNPLYHWTHMELKDPFGITDRLLNEESAEAIWEECNEMLRQPDFSTRSLLKRNKVEVVATTDDPTDSLEYHKKIQQEKDPGVRMVPTFRPDRGMEIENGDEFRKWVAKLGTSTDRDIVTYQDFVDSLEERHIAFHELGCRASDHGVEQPHANSFTEARLNQIFDDVMSGKSPSPSDIRVFKSAFLYHCGRMDHARGWVFQLHMGALRNNNSRMMKMLGRDSGFDSMGDFEIARPLSRLLDHLDRDNLLPRVILYNNNPGNNELLSTMIGNFQDGSIPGKLQHGPAWWFLDQIDGIEQHLESLSNMGILSEFIGMTTDSRSFLSYSRHDYFRRILCNIMGRDIERGYLPGDLALAGSTVKKICSENARAYFRFGAAGKME